MVRPSVENSLAAFGVALGIVIAWGISGPCSVAATPGNW
jgi:hypothetical protein